jgi:hypothetical protein
MIEQLLPHTGARHMSSRRQVVCADEIVAGRYAHAKEWIAVALISGRAGCVWTAVIQQLTL